MTNLFTAFEAMFTIGSFVGSICFALWLAYKGIRALIFRKGPMFVSYREANELKPGAFQVGRALK